MERKEGNAEFNLKQAEFLLLLRPLFTHDNRRYASSGISVIIKYLSNYEFYKIHQSMKNPLLTHFFSLISDRSLKVFKLAIFLMVIQIYSLDAQIPVVSTECICLNNSTTPGNGQFRDSITINTGVPGQEWRLRSTTGNPITGLYNPASQPPPAQPIPYLHNTLIPEVSPGVYKLAGLRISGSPWNGVVVNVTTNASYNLGSTRTCSYPSFALIGDAIVCPGTSENYALPALPAGQSYINPSWLVSPGSYTSTTPALPGAGSTSLTVAWGTIGGSYGVAATGVHRLFATQTTGCNFNVSKAVDILDSSPLTKIQGDLGNCLGARETYTIGAPATSLSGVSWTLATISGATVLTGAVPALPGNNVNTQTIQWPSTPGVYTLTVAGQYAIPGSANVCSFSNTATINIVSEPVVPLVCNNLTNLSMNPSCELSFTPGQFLEAQRYPDYSYDIIIRDIEADTIIPIGTLGFKYIGKTLEIKVVHECSGNSCWGYAKIEDKSIPDLVCPRDITIECTDLNNLNVTGFPTLPVGAVRTPVAGRTDAWTVTGFDKCSSVFLTYKDTAQTGLCTGPFSSIVNRTWSIADNYGNKSFCTQVISVNRANIANVTFPGNWDDVTGPYPSLEACGNWPMKPYIIDGLEQTYTINGVVYKDSVPDPNYTGWPAGTLCLKAALTYTDRKIPLCTNNPKTYKLIRKWTLVDHCTGEIKVVNQLISVMDKTKPIVTCPLDVISPIDNTTVADVIIPANGSCEANWVVKPPIVINECSNYTFTVKFKKANEFGLDPGDSVPFVTVDGTTQVTGTYPNYTIVNLKSGRTWVRYTVTDACGNITECTTEIDVVDKLPPVPVCDRNSIVAVTDNGTAWAGVLTFDDGSHDHCGKVKCMKIRRDMSIPWSSISCDNQLQFTCADIGPNKTIMVELYVEDNATPAMSNTCMVEAKIQDNIIPTLTVPANVTASCDENFTSLTRFGTATATDNCSATVTETREDRLNECGLGTIIRTFTAKDPFGNEVVKTQVITVTDNTPFSSANIDWPDTYTTNSSCATDVTPEKLPDPYSKPKYIGNIGCTQLVQKHEDIVFNFADNVCVKILRKWTVIDWCQKNPFVPGSGEWTYTQLIMLNNVVAPDITKGCQPTDLTITQVGVCRANVKVTAAADDDCTPAEKLTWSYTIDENNDGSIEVSNGASKSIDRDFPYGTHKISWTVKDGCNNAKTCDNIFTIRDDKKPTPVCLTELVTVVMPVAKEVTIWASDFDKGSTDNCSVGNQITASFSATNRNDISRRITCADLAGAASKDFEFKVYAIDASGNSDFCTVKLRVQDNGNSCATTTPPPTTSSTISLKGSVYNEFDEMVQNVNIQLKSDQVEYPKSVMTTVDGRYLLEGLKMNKDYILNPYKNDDILNGVNTLDLVHIQRHILGIASLDSPYKLIAADVNNSQKITAADLVELRKLILGIQNELPNNRSWRFVDLAYKFPDQKNPFPFMEYIQMAKADHSATGLDFIAVKTGDVNGTAKTRIQTDPETYNRSVKLLTTEKLSAKRGEIVYATVNADVVQDMVGMQMTLGIDPQQVELIEIKSDILNLQNQYLGLNQLDKGLINLSWNDEAPVTFHNKLIHLKLRMLKDVVDEPLIRLEKSKLNPELYVKEGNEISVIPFNLMTTNRDKEINKSFEVYQNIPNPFNASTVIGFNLPKAEAATLKLFDVTGKVIYQTKGQFNKGYNTFNLDANQLITNGVLYYQIDTETNSATRKMIVIK
jgi:hypothetical protein